MHIQSWKCTSWRRKRDSQYQFSKSWRVRGFCSLGACHHFRFGTMQSNHRVGKSRFSPTVILLSRNAQLETKWALSRNAEQVRPENSSTQRILSQVSGNPPETDSDQVFIHKHKFKSACMNLRVSSCTFTLLITSSWPETPARDCLIWPFHPSMTAHMFKKRQLRPKYHSL